MIDGLLDLARYGRVELRGDTVALSDMAQNIAAELRQAMLAEISLPG